MVSEQPAHRPGTVTAAAVIVIVLNGLLGLVALLGVIAGILLAVTPQLANRVEGAPGLGTVLAIGGGGIAVIFLLLLAFCVLMILFSVQAMRGRNWARVVSTVFLGLGILGNLGNLAAPMDRAGGQGGSSLFGLALLVLAVVLYWLPPSNRWFSTIGGQRTATAQPAPEPGTSPG